MTAKTFDIYDLNAPFVTPTAPAPTAPAATTAQVTAVEQSQRIRLSAKDLLTWIGLLALVPLLIGEVYYTEVIFEGATDIASLAWLLVVATGNIATGIIVLFVLYARNNDTATVTA